MGQCVIAGITGGSKCKPSLTKWVYRNVWEWCLDWYGDYPTSPVIDPKGPASGSSRVLRGGGWDSLGVECRSAFRAYDEPDDRLDNIGFRLVLAQVEP